MKLGNLNLNPYPPHPTSTYTCKVTITPSIQAKNTTYATSLLTMV